MTIHTIDTRVSWNTATPDNRATLRFAPPQGEVELTMGTDADDAAPSPHDLIDAALASCTALTLRLYAARKAIPLRGVDVKVAHEEGGGVYKMARQITFDGDLTAEQQTMLLRVADLCPVHKTLSGQIAITTEAKAPSN